MGRGIHGGRNVYQRNTLTSVTPCAKAAALYRKKKKGGGAKVGGRNKRASFGSMSLIVPVIYILTHFRPISTRFHPTPEILLRNECMEMMAVECNRRRTRGGNRVLKYRDEECAVTKLLRSFSLYNVISVPFSFHLTFRQAFGSRWTVLNEMHEANINPIRSSIRSLYVHFFQHDICISKFIQSMEHVARAGLHPKHPPESS